MATALNVASKVLDAPTFERQTVWGQFRGHRVRFFGALDYDWSLHVETSMPAIAIDLFEQQVPPTPKTLHIPDGRPLQFVEGYGMDAAPEETAHAIVSKDVGERIVALAPSRVTVAPDGVRVWKKYASYKFDPADVHLAIELAAALAERAHEVQRHMASAGHPFRGDVTDAKHGALAVVDEEVRDALERQKGRGSGYPAAIALAIAIVAMVIAALTR